MTNLDTSQVEGYKDEGKGKKIQRSPGGSPTGDEWHEELTEPKGSEAAGDPLQQKVAALINHRRERWREQPAIAEKLLSLALPGLVAGNGILAEGLALKRDNPGYGGLHDYPNLR